MPETLRPLSLGEILDHTAQLYRRSFLVFAGVAAVPSAVVVAAGLAVLVLIVPFGLVVKHGQQSGLAAGAVGVVLLVAAFAVCIAATVLSQAAITRAAINAYLGRKMKVREALASVRPHFGRYLWLMVLQGLLAAGVPAAIAAVFVGLVALFERMAGLGTAVVGAAGVLLFVAAVVYAVWRVLCYVLAMAISVAEDRPAWPAVQRAVALSRGTRGRIFVMFLVVWALTVALSMIGYVPVLIVTVIMGAAGGAGVTGSVMLVVTEIFNLLVSFSLQTLIAPAYLVALVLFYYDQRIRLEGYDIEWMMQQAGLASLANIAEAGVAAQTSMPLPAPATVKES